MGRVIRCLCEKDALLEQLLVRSGPRQLLILGSRLEVEQYEKMYPDKQAAVFAYDANGQGDAIREQFIVWQHEVQLESIPFLSSGETGKRLRPYGLAKGQFRVPDDFNDPLPDELLTAFEGR